VGFSELDHTFEESKHVPIALEKIPIQPGDFVVLVVGIVVPFLGVHEFVARAEHGGPVGEHEQTEEVLDLLPPQRHDFN
jgi:hypothetical protein